MGLTLNLSESTIVKVAQHAVLLFLFLRRGLLIRKRRSIMKINRLFLYLKKEVYPIIRTPLTFLNI